MHWEILDEKRISLLKALVGMPETADFYLAGGTALSLQLGLRVSYDFDFFCEAPFNADTLYGQIKERWEDVRALHVGRDTCDVVIDGVQVSFMRYPYPMVADAVTGDSESTDLKLYAPEDIAVMKLSAIGSRGARKDFYDLYQIYHIVPHFDSEKLLRYAHMKFGEAFDLTYMIAGMSFFDDADSELMPKMFVPADPEEVKRFFRAEQAIMFDLESKRY